ncbi:Transcription factor dpl-1 [Binucleata daphniae]
MSSSKEGLKSITTQVHNQFTEHRTISYSTLLETVVSRNSNTLKRRVYDVLSVLRALNIVEKKNKAYHLKEKGSNDVKNKIKTKTKELEKLKECKNAILYMIERNKSRGFDFDRLYTPFVVVSTGKNVTVNCEINEERDFFKIISEQPIEIMDDLGVIKELYEKRGNEEVKIHEEIMKTENNYNLRL